MSEQKKRSGKVLERVAAFIVDKRALFFLLYVFAIIFSVFAASWVEVEEDVTSYLAEGTETRLGIEAMNENFAAIATARVMISNVTYETAEELYDRVCAIDGVAMATFGRDEEHYKNAYALFDVTFSEGSSDERTISALAAIREELGGYDLSIDTTIGSDVNAMLDDEMAVILVVAVIMILVVLTLTSRSYGEIPVLLLTFGIAALLNMGTNFLCGKISFISDSVGVVLQLALALDYAIIICHRFSDEFETREARDACVLALSKAIPEVSASSLTTICGLAALGFMDFKLGLDMATVLIKSILISLVCVFTLMPGLLMLFSGLIQKTRHRKLLPNIDFLGKMAVKTRRVLPPLFLLVLVGAFYLSGNCPYCFSYNDMRTPKLTEQQEAYFKIKETFGNSNMVALLVPAGDYESEGKILRELEEYPEVKSVMGLANIEAMGGYMLTDALTARQLSELINMDYEVVQLLYTTYAMESDQYGEIISGLEEYKVPMFDMFIFLKDMMESKNISLDSGEMAGMGEMLAQLETAQTQMQSENYSRMVIYLNLPEESEETFAFLTEIRNVVGQYYEEDYFVVGNSTSCRDLSESFSSDNLIISILSALFVIIVLLFTFQSAGLPVLLIVVIQGSIWINFSIPTLMDQALYFMGYLIVSAIQMGANIDYAIVISSHYQDLKKTMPHKEAIVQALNEAFPTIFTSGIMMSVAGLLIGNMSAQPVVAIMGSCLGRGTIISIILVLCVLPSILVLGDSIIERTSFNIKVLDLKTQKASGAVRVRGRVRGYLSGMVDGEFNGVLRGELNAIVSTGGEILPQDGEKGGEPDE